MMLLSLVGLVSVWMMLLSLVGLFCVYKVVKGVNKDDYIPYAKAAIGLYTVLAFVLTVLTWDLIFVFITIVGFWNYYFLGGY